MTAQTEALRIAAEFESFAIDHAPNGWPAIQQRDLTNAAIMLRHQQERIAELEAEVQALREANNTFAANAIAKEGA